jgi:hypothetical protein
LGTLKISLEVNAIMEMQQFFPTDSFDCDDDLYGYDACIFRAGSAFGPYCILPFQNWSTFPNMQNRICQKHAEGYESFQHFQLASHACKVPCTQLNTIFNYYMPQYLYAIYLPDVQRKGDMLRYYLNLPTAIKLSRSSPSYGFITFIAEVAGWYNLFLGGSIFALWEVLAAKMVWAFAKIQGKLSQVLSQWRNSLYILVSSGILLYIFIDCITVLFCDPVGSSTLLTNFIAPGLSLSICLPKYTSANDKDIKEMDLAYSTEFWENGNKLSNKLLELNVIMQEGNVLSIWHKNQSATFKTERNIFSIFNIVSSNQSVDFCHTVDLSTVPGNIRGVQLRAVNDIYLVVHLSGQLLAAQTKYAAANIATVQSPSTSNSIFLYNSIVNLQLEETSFQKVTSQACKNYNTTWTYDSCVINLAIMSLESNQILLRGLLMPSNNSTVQQGIDRAVLQKLYATLLSWNDETVCLPDCRSLIVNMRTEKSLTLDKSFRPIPKPFTTNPLPLPPLLVDVNITLPDLSKLMQVIIYSIIFRL